MNVAVASGVSAVMLVIMLTIGIGGEWTSGSQTYLTSCWH